MSRAVALTVALLALAALPTGAQAAFGIVPGSVDIQVLDAQGDPEQRAGAHPDRVLAGVELTTTPGGLADGNVKDIAIDLPPGFIGDPAAVPRCPRLQFVLGSCPAEAQVGVARTTFAGLGEQPLPIYNVVTEPDRIAEFGFLALVVPVRIAAGLRAESDYGTQVALSDLPQDVPLLATEIELWGVPADHQGGTGIPRKPFLTNPTRCETDPLTGALRVRSWQQPDEWLTVDESAGPPLVGCADLPFEPAVDVALSRTEPDTPTGVRVDLTLPQASDPDGLATSHIEDAAVALPEGLTLSPGVADGLTGCTDAQFGLGSRAAPTCPLSSKVGMAELESTALPAVLEGGIYLGKPRAGDPYRLFVTARGPGFTVKIPSSLRADPSTGRIEVVMSRLPQLPFDRFTLRFKDGARAPLATPATCGAGTTEARLKPYAGAPVTRTDTVTIGSPGACPLPQPFAPLFAAGSSPALAARSSRFSMTVRRADGQQPLDRMTLDLPPGLAARLQGVERCAQALAAAASCPATSRVGSVLVEAGAGPSPFELTGGTYLTGPYRGAPLGLALMIRGIAGPFDLGTVVVRAALRVDPVDGHLTVSTDSLPQILDGIPLRLRTLAIDIDRPGFMRNPTACDPDAVTAEIRSLDGAESRSRSKFALGGCRRLGFAPRVSVSLRGRNALIGPGRPGLEIRLRSRAGGAGLRDATVTLPRLLSLDQDVVDVLCSKRRARAGRCPAASRVGTARARTPLLSEPLTGFVHLVQVEGRAVPELWAVLEGDGIRVVMRSKASRPRRGRPLRSTFVGLPDLPMSSFALHLSGGRGGMVTTRAGLCSTGRGRLVAKAALRAHNGKRSTRSVAVAVRPGCRGVPRLPASGGD